MPEGGRAPTAGARESMKRVLVRVFRDPFQPVNPVRVWRENQVSGNTGNLLFSDAAVRAVACEDVEVTCWTDAEMSERAEEVAERFDHVVIPLANAFRNAYRGRLQSLTSTIRTMATPVTVLGVGAQSSADYDLEAMASVDETAREFARAVLEHSGAIGVRGEFTARYLASLGFDEVEVIGCPSMFVHGDRMPAQKPLADTTTDLAISLGLTPDAPMDAQWLDELVAQHPRLSYIPQDRIDLETMIWGHAEVAGPRSQPGFPSDLSHPVFADRVARIHLDPRSWIEDLRSADLAIGTRIHGVIAGLLAGIPAHLLVHDSRTRELAEHFGIPHTRIDGGRALPSLEEVLAADASSTYRAHPARWEQFSAFLDRQDLPHVWRESAVSTYDDRLPPVTAPVVVDHGRTPTPAEVLAWVEEYHSASVVRLERQAARQRAQLRRQARTASGLRREVKELRRDARAADKRAERLAGRLDELGAQVAELQAAPSGLRERLGAAVRRREE